MMRLSWRILILCLILLLGAGIGIGQAIAAGQMGVLGSQIAQQQERVSTLSLAAVQREEQLATLDSKTQQLKDETARLALYLQEKQDAYDSLLAKQGGRVEELQRLQASFASLTEEYRSLRDDYDTLLETPAGITARELISLKEQVSLLEKANSLLHIHVVHLIEEYRGLRGAYDALLEAPTDVTARELMSLREQVSLLERANSLLHIHVAQLTDRLTPAPNHATPRDEIWGRPEFRSTAWAGRDYELMRKIEYIARLFHHTHTFIQGEFDCNDIAVSLWNMLLTEGIKSVIVIGNLDMAGETFEESNHSWLFVFDAQGAVIYLEPTTGEVIFGRRADGSINPRAIPYREGFIFVRPSDLRRDLKGRW